MKNYTIRHYNGEGERIVSLLAMRIDIVSSHSLFYYANSDYLVYRVFSSVSSVNIERGIITVYYVDHSYIIITEKI